jgi:hypothetical protein
MKNSVIYLQLAMIAVLGVIPFPLAAQQIFQMEYTHGTAAPFVIETVSDGYLVAGGTEKATAGGLDGFLMKIDASGSHVWSRAFGGVKDDRFFSIRRLRNGNFILSGITKSFVSAPSDSANIYLVEIDSKGSVIRSSSIGTGHYDISYSVKETADNGLVIAGATDSSGFSNAYLVKLDSQRSTVWAKVFRGSANDSRAAKGVVQTSDGGFAFTCYFTRTSAPADTNLFIVQVDSAGNLVHSKEYSFTDSVNYAQRGAFGYDIVQNSFGHLVVVGAVGGFYTAAFSNIYSWLLIEVNSAGALINSKCFSLNTGDSRALSVQQTPDGSYILGGYMGNYYLTMIKANSFLITQWCYFYALAFNPKAKGYCVRNTQDGGYILSGSLIPGTAIRVVKTLSDGISGCVQATPGFSGTSGYISLKVSNLPWVTTESGSAQTIPTMTNQADVSSSVICSNVGVREFSDERCLIVYPNPVSTVLTLVPGDVQIVTITNSLGEIVIQNDVAGRPAEKVEMDISTLAPGVYFARARHRIQKFVKE